MERAARRQAQAVFPKLARERAELLAGMRAQVQVLARVEVLAGTQARERAEVQAQVAQRFAIRAARTASSASSYKSRAFARRVRRFRCALARRR
jgi:hypothetical protein